MQVCGWWLIARGIAGVPVHIGSIGLLMQPLATVILGWVLLRESLGPLQILGTLLILLGIALGSLSPPRIHPGSTVPGST